MIFRDANFCRLLWYVHVSAFSPHARGRLVISRRSRHRSCYSRDTSWDDSFHVKLHPETCSNMSIATHRNYISLLTRIVRHGCTVDALRTPSISSPENGTLHIAYNATLATADYTVWRQLWSLTLKARPEHDHLQFLFLALTITHCSFNSLPYFSMCWTTYPNTCSIPVAGSRYISAKPAGPVTPIALLSYCITCNVLIVPFFKCNLRSNLQNILCKRYN